MPLYEYQCKDCGHKFSALVSWLKRNKVKCPKCGGDVQRLPSSFAVNSSDSNSSRGTIKFPFG